MGVLGFDSDRVGFMENNLKVTGKVIPLFGAQLRAVA
jgi:hypothetical protein